MTNKSQKLDQSLNKSRIKGTQKKSLVPSRNLEKMEAEVFCGAGDLTAPGLVREIG